MVRSNCPQFGHRPTGDETACPQCGHAVTNGAVQKTTGAVPYEVRGWVLYKTSPEFLAEAKETFDLQGRLSGVREIKESGGRRLEDFIGEIKDEARRRD